MNDNSLHHTNYQIKIELFKDLIFLLTNYLSCKDILNFSSSCKKIRDIVLNIDFWKRILYTKHNSDLWMFVSFGNVFEPIKLLLNYSRGIIELFLRYGYIMYRLSQPQSSKKFFKFYLQINTPSLPNGHKQDILVGELLSDEDVDKTLITSNYLHTHNDKNNITGYKGFFIRFKKLNGNSAYYWQGEENHHSNVSYYIIDRQICGSVVGVTPHCFKNHKSVLGKKDYKIIGKMLYNDENFYQQNRSTSYNLMDSHSFQKFHTQRFGENNNSIIYPNINVACLTHIDAFFSTNDIFFTLCSKE
jgi:hypothetical protein